MNDIISSINNLSKLTTNEYIEKHMLLKKNVVGYFCSYIPEEIFTAADIIPYRMRGVGSEGTELADAYYSSKNCSYPKNILNKILKGEYDFLSGIVIMNGCDHIRRMYDILRHKSPAYDKFIHFVDVPHKTGKLQYKWYINMLQNFISTMEEYFNIEITDEALSRAIKLHNKKRDLLREIHELRKDSKLNIKGSIILKLMLSITFIPVNEAITFLEKFLAVIKVNQVQNNKSIRIILTGGCLEDISHIEIIEELGGTVVVDNTCPGYRYSSIRVKEEESPLKNIASGYLEHLSCARMTNLYKQRLDFIKTVYKDFCADGIIFEKLPFCVLYGGEMYLYRNEFKKYNYPFLAIEREYNDRASGQIKTRIQAFLEGIENSSL